MSFLVFNFLSNEKFPDSEKQKFLDVFNLETKSEKEILFLVKMFKQAGLLEKAREEIDIHRQKYLKGFDKWYHRDNREEVMLLKQSFEDLLENKLD